MTAESLPGRAPSGPGGAEGGHPQPPSAARSLIPRRETSYAETSVRRIARKQHRCGSCGGGIRPGDAHLEHVAFPGHDALGLGATRPERMRECARCACRYGRDFLLDAPYDQCCRDGLL